MKAGLQEQVHYIDSHFVVRNAEVVAQILDKRSEYIRPWKVYALLGSYDFGT